MLSLAKLAGPNQRYYLDQVERRVDHTESVASGAEDYYLSGPEAAGRWTGSGSRVLGLRGEVTEGALRAVLSKQHPDGRPLEGSVSQARVPGFDLMFSVPKSASILFGIGDEVVQRAVLDAQAGAVDAALKYLEEHACRSRRGRGGYEIVPGDGFVGAAFRHRTSRAGDPQIHTHVLVANATRIHDGTWGSLDGRAVYAEARTAGFIHEAVFRQELSQRLGVSWTLPRNGIAEIEGVPKEAIRAFSQRKAEIEAQIQEWGVDSAAARQSAAVQTRRRKDYEVTPEQLAPEWRQRAVAFGLDREAVRELLRRPMEDRPPFRPDLVEHLASPAGLTEQQASFDRRDATRAVAELAQQGASLWQIQDGVRRFLASREVVTLAEPGGLMRAEDVIRLRDGRIVSAVVQSPRYSTGELLAVEQRIVDAAITATGAGAGIVEPEHLELALGARPTMGDDQRRMVERLCLGGEGMQVVVGPPGTGKTFALAAAREAWEAAGFSVYGTAVARRAAVELMSSAGIESTSVAALLTELRQGAPLLNDRTVLVVDEAAMLGTRHLAELVERTREVGAKLVLGGDHEQLPEIDAGGAFRALVNRTKPIVLETNRRQVREEDRQMLSSWRAGDLRNALTISTVNGDLVLDATPEEATARLVVDFCDALERGDDAIMLAPRRIEVAALNAAARERLLQAGRISGRVLEIEGRVFAAGDEVVLRLNDARLGVQNGTRGTVLEVDGDASAIVIQTRQGERRELPSRYVLQKTRSGTPAVEHGYALTAHLAQGMTTDRAFVLGSETVYREWGYVAVSRARHGTKFYVVEPELAEEHHTAAPPEVDRFAETVRRLDRSEAQHAGIDSLPQPSDPIAAAGKHGQVIYLEQALGERPDGLWRARRWDRAARRIERYRRVHGIDDRSIPFGPQPEGRLDRVLWRKAVRDLDRSRMGLGLPPQDGLDRGVGH